jgi:hypothetical protein
VKHKVAGFRKENEKIKSKSEVALRSPDISQDILGKNMENRMVLRIRWAGGETSHLTNFH